VDSGNEFVDAPDWLLELVSATSAKDGAKGRPLEDWHKLLTEPLKNGERNVTLTSICGKLLHSGVTDLILLLDIMQCVNIARCEQALPDDEIDTLVRSVVRTHLKKLRHG
jgi:Primase C terminal 1 (PriCT-1)